MPLRSNVAPTPAATSAVPMTADQFLRGAGFNILLVVAAGILASFMFPPREVWWFAWLYLVPLLVALRRTAAVRAAGWLMLLFGIVFFWCTLSWLRTIFGVSVVGICVLTSLPWILFGVSYRALAGRIATWPSRLWVSAALVIMAPIFWLAVEWIRCEGWYFQFSWAQFGFAMASCRRGGVIYPYLGVYGVTFLIMLVNALVAEIMLAKRRWWHKLLMLAPCAAVLIPFSYYLNYPIGSPVSREERTSAFRVVVIQNETGNLDELTEQTLKHAKMKPKLVVWPEYAIMDYPLSDPMILGKLQAVAREMHSTLILGCKSHVSSNARVDWLRRRAMMSMEGALFGNTALVIAPDGKVLGSYRKTHPIQFFSDGVPGRSYPTFQTDIGRVGIGICYDFDFASCPRRLVQNGAEVLVAPTFDAVDWTELQHVQHARMAQARAAETGRWVVRATTSGDSLIIDPAGRADAVIWSSEPGTTVGLAVARRQLTPYLRGVYLLPYLCLGISLLWALWTVGSWSVARLASRKLTLERNDD